MKNLTLIAGAIGIALLIAPYSGAQTPPPQTPPTTQAPVAPTPLPAPVPPTPEAPAAQPAQTPVAPARTCRTRKEAGEACACLSAPSEVGTVEAATDGGRNMCVIPASQ
jgi:hypothetical protein